MCKVFMIAGIKDSTVNKAWAFAKAISKPMSRGNTDGLGYAAITADGQVFGERWLNNDHAFKDRTVDMDKEVVSRFGEAVETKSEVFDYNKFGDIQLNKAVAITLHTRYATSAKGMQNTHPFVEGNTSLIHNGVIRNDHEFKLTRSTCDSEAILVNYLEKEIAKDPNKFQEVADALRGYYACGVLTNSEEGPVLDVFKTTARLHVAYVKELETFVISTDDDDIKNTCKEFGYACGQVYTILSGRFIRVNAITGKEKCIIKFDPSKDYTTYTGSHYSGGGNNYSNPPPATTTQTSSTNTTDTGTAGKTGKTTNILPMGKSRKNTDIPETHMEYFRSGSPKITKLSEREIQEHLMEQERLMGSSRY